MIKRVVIAGCRQYENYEEAKIYIELCLRNIRKKHQIIILSGGCKGADLLGEKFALDNGFKIERFPANWEKYGKSAGPKRNQKMARVCDYVICFWDGKSSGTQSMLNYAKLYNKPLRIKFITKDK